MNIRKKMIKGVFFDLFGTLLRYTDMQRAWDKWIQALYKGFKDSGLTLPQNLFALKCDGFLAKGEPVINNKNFTIYEKRIYSLGIELNLQLEINTIRSIVNNTINAWQKYVPLDPDAISILGELREDKILALITNFDHPPYVYSLLQKYNLSNFFSSIIISGEVGVKKPDPSIFISVLKDTNLKPNEVCYVGDTIEDMEAALGADIYPILIQRNPDTDKVLPSDYYIYKSQNLQNDRRVNFDSVKIIKSLKELINIIN
ncbi:MAG: HAD family hydrolase [Candidatus Thorarchaeota archaeon]